MNSSRLREIIASFWTFEPAFSRVWVPMRRGVRVRVVFEPIRVAGAQLRASYELVVPIARRRVHSDCILANRDRVSDSDSVRQRRKVSS